MELKSRDVEVRSMMTRKYNLKNQLSQELRDSNRRVVTPRKRIPEELSQVQVEFEGG